MARSALAGEAAAAGEGLTAGAALAAGDGDGDFLEAANAAVGVHKATAAAHAPVIRSDLEYMSSLIGG